MVLKTQKTMQYARRTFKNTFRQLRSKSLKVQWAIEDHRQEMEMGKGKMEVNRFRGSQLSVCIVG